MVDIDTPSSQKYTSFSYRYIHETGHDWFIRASNASHVESGAGAQYRCILFFCAYFSANIFDGTGPATNRLEVKEVLVEAGRTWRISTGPLTVGAGVGAQINQLTLTGYTTAGASVAQAIHALPIGELEGSIEVFSGLSLRAKRSIGTLLYEGFVSRRSRSDIGLQYQLSDHWAVGVGSVAIERTLFEPKKKTLLQYPTRFHYINVAYRF